LLDQSFLIGGKNLLPQTFGRLMDAAADVTSTANFSVRQRDIRTTINEYYRKLIVVSSVLVVFRIQHTEG
jgi:hypothetical protein